MVRTVEPLHSEVLGTRNDDLQPGFLKCMRTEP